MHLVIVASEAEYEIATLFLNFQTTIVLRITIKELGHAQSTTSMQVDNTTKYNYVHHNLRQKSERNLTCV